MGMSTYYLKARFASAKKAAAALPQFEALISEGISAEEWWGTSTQQCDDAFWHDFKQRFRLVFDHLSPAIRSDPHAVSCFLNFSDNDQREPTVHGKFLYYAAYLWHFADWGMLVKFLKKKLGALGADWINEESVDPFDLLNP